ncbi:hypothetical protein VP1G_10720 [Cytospora mali]|uniref:Uncharacterized protein n=1 Tax=Cytospora mali TaxID=578113 RepID=A0A194UTZ1_CYTMA|nr:hypothetical protein VP1G_10720 [Valsa mali var. pyri (nom. inval.)]
MSPDTGNMDIREIQSTSILYTVSMPLLLPLPKPLPQPNGPLIPVSCRLVACTVSRRQAGGEHKGAWI